MTVSPTITFRHLDPSPALEAKVREYAEKLDKYYDRIMSCRVIIEAQHRHHHKGNLYHVRFDVTVPDHEIVVNRAPAKHHEHEDVYVAIRESFEAARRQLQDYARRKRDHSGVAKQQPGI